MKDRLSGCRLQSFISASTRLRGKTRRKVETITLEPVPLHQRKADDQTGRRDRVAEDNGDQWMKASEQAEQKDLGKMDELWRFELGGVCVLGFGLCVVICKNGS